ncbi:hypothetical protein RVR_6051 [Actinacidiphila reveromycinica]|uniref:AB hydrolase-1 domain-containing protein n=2 Tax=Actinacidiphila reveromycinica TaxID=659352 RepID=A0A7U3US96_9ACTN|nr:hypothetical protein RVR_6051 [Streptomyces sp. SN-593]
MLRAAVAPPTVDRGTALTVMERFGAVNHLVASLEYLARPGDRDRGGLNDWQVARGQFARWPRPARAALDAVGRPAVTRTLHVARVAAAGALLLPLPRRGRFAADLVLSASCLALYPRNHYGTDGADQAAFVVQTAATVARAAEGRPRTVDACLWFAGLQSVLSYTASGWVKASSPTWRSGRALPGVLRTASYGEERAWRLVRDHPRAAKAVCACVVALESAFPAVHLARGRAAKPLVAAAAGFHLANAGVMGLGRFLTGFCALHPAVLYVTGPRERVLPGGGVQRRDDTFPVAAGAALAAALTAGAVVRARDRRTVLRGRGDERRFVTSAGTTLVHRVTGPPDPGRPRVDPPGPLDPLFDDGTSGARAGVAAAGAVPGGAGQGAHPWPAAGGAGAVDRADGAPTPAGPADPPGTGAGAAPADALPWAGGPVADGVQGAVGGPPGAGGPSIGPAADGGTVVVLCGALADSPDRSEWLVRALARRHRVVTYHRAGQAGSTAAPRTGPHAGPDAGPDAGPGHGLDAAAADLADLVLHVAGGRPAFLVGHGVGGVIAASAATRLEGRLAGLVLVDPHHPGDVPRPDPDEGPGGTAADDPAGAPDQREVTALLDQMTVSLRLGLGQLLRDPDWLRLLPPDVRGLARAHYRDAAGWSAARGEWRALRARAAAARPGEDAVPAAAVPTCLVLCEPGGAPPDARRALQEQYARRAPHAVVHAVDASRDDVLAARTSARAVAELVTAFAAGSGGPGRDGTDQREEAADVPAQR